jgi:hypothetical protein
MPQRLNKQTWVELRRLFVSGWTLGGEDIIAPQGAGLAQVQLQEPQYPTCCHSVGCGMTGRTRAAMQPDTPSTAADHITR